MALTNLIMAGPWQALSPLPAALSNGLLLADDRHLFMVGGTTASLTLGTPTVYGAAVTGDGQIDAWKFVGALPKNTGFINGMLKDGYLYWMGGFVAPLDNLYFSKVSADGQLGAFTGAQLPGITVARLPNMLPWKGKMLLAGGAGAAAGQTVLVGSVDPVLGSASFQTTTPLPVPLQAGAAAIHGGYLYMIGGSTDGSAAGAVAAVYSSKINDDGTIGAWTQVGALPVALYRMAWVNYKGRLIIIGGLKADASNSGSIYWAELGRDGQIGSFQTEDQTVPGVPARNMTAVTVGNRLFLAAGFTTVRLANVWSINLSY